MAVHVGRVKSEHAGRLAAFDSQVTLIHSERLAVFTANNGPLYSDRYTHLSLHFLILDAVIASNATHRLIIIFTLKTVFTVQFIETLCNNL